MKTLLTVSLIILCMAAVPAFGAVQAVETIARDFVSLLDKKEFAKAVDFFDSNMKKAVSPDTLYLDSISGYIWLGISGVGP